MNIQSDDLDEKQINELVSELKNMLGGNNSRVPVSLPSLQKINVEWLSDINVRLSNLNDNLKDASGSSEKLSGALLYLTRWGVVTALLSVIWSIVQHLINYYVA